MSSPIKICCALFLLLSTSHLLAQNSSLVTAAHYCAFLNAVASNDPYHLYKEKMGSDPETAYIIRFGTPGNYSYAPITGRENFPINYMNWFDEARFCNWLKNEKLTREQAVRSLEDGAYTLKDTDDVISKNVTASCWIADDHVDDAVIEASNILFSIASNGPLELMYSGDADIVSDEAGSIAVDILESIIAAVMAEEGVRFFNEGEFRDHPDLNTRDEAAMPNTDRRLMAGSKMHSEAGLSDSGTETLLLKNEYLGRKEPCDQNESATSIYPMNKIGTTDALDISRFESTAVESTSKQKTGDLLGVPVVDISEGVASREHSPTSPAHLKSIDGELHNITQAGLRSVNQVVKKGVSFPFDIEKREEFKNLTKDLKRAIIEIHKDPNSDLEKPNKEAAANAEAYPRVKAFVQQLCSEMEQDPTLRTNEAAQLFCDATVEAIELAFKSVNPENLIPIKINHAFAIDHVIQSKKIPYSMVPYEQVEFIDHEVTTVLCIANDAIDNLRETGNVLTLHETEAGEALLKSQQRRATRTSTIAGRRSMSALNKECFLKFPPYHVKDTSSAAELELKIAAAELASNREMAYSQECDQACYVINRSSPIIDPALARQQAITDILSIAQAALKASDDVITTLASRKIN